MTLSRTFGGVLGVAALIVIAVVASHLLKSPQLSIPNSLPPMHSVCIGRLVIDVPSDMDAEGGVELYYGLGHDFQTARFELVNIQADTVAFDAAVSARLASLTKEHDDSTPSKNMLAASRRIDDRTVLVLSHQEPVMQGYYLAEILLMRGSSIGRLTRKVYNTDQPRDIEAKLIELAGRVTIGDTPIPTTKGTCLGPFVIDGAQDGEVFNVSMRSSRHPDVRLNIMINSIIAEDDGDLLQRVDSKASLLASLGVTSHTLRRGKASVSQRPAEELIDSAKDHGKSVRLFDIETTLTKPSSIPAPQIHLHMAMGGQLPAGDYVDASLSEADSLALWDAIVRSVRARPGAT